MPQLSVYIDRDTLTKVSEAAQARNTSVSKLVTGIVARELADDWPPGFAATYGSIVDPSFVAPDEIDATLDCPRNEL